MEEQAINSLQSQVPEETINSFQSQLPEETINSLQSQVRQETINSLQSQVPEETTNSFQSQFREEIINSFQSQVPEESLDQEDRHAEVSSFSIDQEMLSKLVADNSFASLHQSGGIHGIAAALETDLDTGTSGQEMDLRRRRETFGSNLNIEDNSILNNKSGYFRRVIVDSVKDTTVILLLCCAILSLLLEIKRDGYKEGILDGVIVFVVISSVVCIDTVAMFLKNRRNEKLSTKRKAVTVVRDGRVHQVAASEVVVGDIVCLKTGNQAPADGLFIRGKELKLDEDDVDDEDNIDNVSANDRLIRWESPSIFTGAKVMGGDCCMLVTAVGENTESSKMMKLLKSHHQNKESKLQSAADKMTSRMEKILLILSLFVLVVQLIRCFSWETGCGDEKNDHNGVKNAVQQIMMETTKIIKKQDGSFNRYVEMLSIVVFAIRDGLPLGLLISLAYASKQLTCYGVIVRKLSVIGSISSITAICTEKSSDLSLDHAKMIDWRIGIDNVQKSVTEFSVNVLNALREAIGATSPESTDDHVLLFWAKKVLEVDREKMKQNCTIKTFDINKSRAGFFLKWNAYGKNSIKMHWKGSPETILSMCTHYFDRHGSLETLDEHKREVLKKIIKDITADSLQCIAFACKQVEEDEDDKKEEIKLSGSALTWLGLAGLKNPYASEVKQAIEVCGESGIKLKLILKDDINTARLIAINSGILNPKEDTKEAVVEAIVFRNSSEEARSHMVDKIKVMANSSPLDKLLMIKCLKQKGEIVAVTGMSIRDSPPMKEADVGVLLGEKGSQVAKENSDIVILDKKFTTTIAILNIGRSCVCNNIRKFIQLHLTLNIAAFMINQVAVLSFNEVPLESFPLLLVNLIMDVFGALALAAPISPRQSAVAASIALTTKTMWKNIIVQVLYQVSILLTILFKGKKLLHVNQMILKAIVFNSFALCQISVLMNAREIEKPNIFEGKRLHQNLWFLVILVFIFILEITILEIVATVSHGNRLYLKHWCVCIGIAVISQPIGLVTKWISWPC